MNKTRYFTGNPCPRGHVSERLVSTRACYQCVQEKKNLWSENNPAKVNSQKLEWRKNNLDKARALNLANQKLHRDSANARNRKYSEKNRETLKLKNQIWEKNNPDKVAARVARRRAAKLNQVPKWFDPNAVKRVYERAKELRLSGQDVHVDHIIPLQGRNVCGLHVHDNLQILSANANRRKSNSLRGI